MKCLASSLRQHQVDAICLNQNDAAECSAQILRMQAFYASAKTVLVATDTAADDRFTELTWAVDAFQPGLNLTNQNQALRSFLGRDSVHCALQDFCEDHYWRRTWIVQEFAVGHDIQFLMAGQSIDSDKLFSICELIDQEIHLKRKVVGIQVRSIRNIRQSVQDDKPFQLLQLLQITIGSLCKVKHDRVFGILGLSIDAVKYLPEPNYVINPPALSINITQAYIERNKLDIIFLAPHREASDLLPSWAPNLFAFDEYVPDPRVIELLTGPRSWSATGQSRPQVSFRSNALLTSALCIGTVTSLGLVVNSGAHASPRYDSTWKRQVTHDRLCREIFDAMLAWPDENSAQQASELRNMRDYYRYRHAGNKILRKFNDKSRHDLKGLSNQALKWFHDNRKFYVGSGCLMDHSRERLLLKMAMDNSQQRRQLEGIERKVGSNMQLMCIEGSTDFGIGWASIKADLRDQVFLIPGCTRPVILRPRLANTFQMIGDAIVVGAMENEIWAQTDPQDLKPIEII